MSVAQWERRSDQRAAHRGHERTQTPRRPPRGAGFGWQWTGPDATGRKQLIPHPKEQAAVRRICALYRQGLSVHTIAKRLDRDGIPRPRRQKAGSRPALDLYRILERGRLKARPLRSASGNRLPGRCANSPRQAHRYRPRLRRPPRHQPQPAPKVAAQLVKEHLALLTSGTPPASDLCASAGACACGT